VFDAPRERLYRAFIDRSLRSQWLRPADDWVVPTTELDATPGGSFRDVFVAPDGERFEESGVFRELRPHERIVYSCRFEGGGVLEQTGYRELENRDEQEQGWPAFLDQLAKVLRA